LESQATLEIGAVGASVDRLAADERGVDVVQGPRARAAARDAGGEREREREREATRGHARELDTLRRPTRRAGDGERCGHRGMLPCLRRGFSCRLLRSSANARATWR